MVTPTSKPANAQTPSKRSAVSSSGVADLEQASADDSSPTEPQDGASGNDTVAVDDVAATPSKRPRVYQADDGSRIKAGGVGAAGRAAAAAAMEAAAASLGKTTTTNLQEGVGESQQSSQHNDVIDITKSQTPLPPRNNEVIEISSTPTKPPPSSSTKQQAGTKNNVSVHIKKDPAAPPPNRMSITMDADSDSDIEILTPSKYPSRPTNGSNSNNGDLNNTNNKSNNTMKHDATTNPSMEMDDLEITSSNTTNANIDYPHMRHSCGLHTFTRNVASNGYLNNNAQYCNKCYCFVCDTLASECKSWNGPEEGGNGGSVLEKEKHCHAHDKDTYWVQKREVAMVKRGVQKQPVDTGEVTLVNGSGNTQNNPYQRVNNAAANPYAQYAHGSQTQAVTSLIHNEFLARLAESHNDGGTSAAEEQRRQRIRERKDMRITEVLLENFRKAVSLQEKTAREEMQQQKANKGRVAAGQENDTSNNQQQLQPAQAAAHQKMEGDIPTLSLYNSFFVNGVKIGWPFPQVMKPQRQMAIHLIKALKDKKHVVLESPTGTGKSAAILCSVLAWQRHHYKMEKMKRQKDMDEMGISSPMTNSEDGDNAGGKVQKVKIIYCSRTHSQVAQMVSSLKSTPYRPRMAILGSRERLCIHKSIKPRGQNAEAVQGVNVNNECRLRVRNTEKARKHRLTNTDPSRGERYNDDDPPEVMPGDGDGGGQQDGEVGGGPEEEGDNDNNNQAYLRKHRTCPHYRQLTTSRVANLAHATFLPNAKVDCCSVGGKKTKQGAHDIEDLVKFGVDPYLQKDVALYRKQPTDSFGLQLKSGGGRGGGCFVQKIRKDTPADNGSINAGDRILRVNGSDVSNAGPATVVEKIKSVSSDPLLLDVSRGGDGSLSSGGDGEYSSRAACPYYLSQVLSKDADIVFAPYNYVLDPGIREALGIELGNSVVVLDEAHNVESTLRDAGSGKFSEFELCELIVMLNNYAITERSTNNMMDVSGDAGLLGMEAETEFLCDVAHALLLFVEKVVNKLRTSRTCFQNNPGAKGAAKAIRDWEKFHSSDDTEFEITFDGPTGKGHNGKCVGCLPFFDKLGISKDDFAKLTNYVDAFEKFFRGHESNDGSTEKDRISNLVDRLMELVHKLNAAINTPEHYYAAVLATANGSLEFASGGEQYEGDNGRRSKKKPRALPLIDPKTPAYPDRPANPCSNKFCREQHPDPFNPMRHGDYCNGTTPKWEAHLHLDLLTPGPLMQQLANECRTVILASGSLAPIPSLCAELNLFSEDVPPKMNNNSVSHPDPTSTTPKIQKRLQSHPKPLEADHVVNLEKQLFAVSIGHFPDGSELKVAHRNYSQADFLPKLGDALVRIVEGIPHGGVLIFLPSYALLRKCERAWNPNSFGRNRRAWWSQNDEGGQEGPSVWDRLTALKHNVIVEPTGGQDEFEEKKQEYMDSVKNQGGCILIAVFRGKMSEGISFNDNNARGVICVGLPLPSAFALPVKSKINYNDEQRLMRQRTDLLPGREWYNQQAYRAIAQALGRCIRHAADYGAIFLLDIRHCDDGSPNNGIPQAHKNLPKWMRHTVRNLSRGSAGRNSMFSYVTSSSNSIQGGWPGLKSELRSFFRAAKPHATGVLKEQKQKLAAANNSTVVHTFNVQTNTWSQKENPKPSSGVTASSSCQSSENGESSSADITTNQPNPATSSKTTTASSSSSGNKNLDVVNGKPSMASQNSAKKKGTLQEMFKKQQATNESSQKRPPSSSSKSMVKKGNNPTPKTLKSMFEKQRAAAATSPVPKEEEMMDVQEEDQEEGVKQPSASASDISTSQSSGSQPVASTSDAPNGNPFAAYTFKRSPFVDEQVLTPATEVAASTSQLVLTQGPTANASQLEIIQSQAGTNAEEEERLCVVCEDGKKEVLLMPCKHLCLCKSCADTCLFSSMKECPMCRTVVSDSMQVFW